MPAATPTQTCAKPNTLKAGTEKPIEKKSTDPNFRDGFRA
jgi:hypothetical protein